MSPTSKTTDEPKQTLPAGHPRAGYVSPDLSHHVGTGTLPPEEIEWHEARNDAREEEIERVENDEDKAAKEEQEASAKEAERLRKWAEENPGVPAPAAPPEDVKTTTTTTPKSTTSS